MRSSLSLRLMAALPPAKRCSASHGPPRAFARRASIAASTVSDFHHVPVMPTETIRALLELGAADGGGPPPPPPLPTGGPPAGAPRLFVDCTVGGGGHAALLCAALSAARAPWRVLGLDRDGEALAASARALAPWPQHVTLAHSSYERLEPAAREAFGLAAAASQLSGVLADLGVSSHQLDAPARGFSVRADRDGPLDMRFDGGAAAAAAAAGSGSAALTAADLVNLLPARELRRVFVDFGEAPVHAAASVADAVVLRRAARPFASTLDLAATVAAAIDRAARRRRQRVAAAGSEAGGAAGALGSHPAARYFQALRIAVNGELEAVSALLGAAPALLRPGGRFAVITFHSLEDRLVKRAFAALCADGAAGAARYRHVRDGAGELVVRPSSEELAANPRARSAKLRAVERVA